MTEVPCKASDRAYAWYPVADFEAGSWLFLWSSQLSPCSLASAFHCTNSTPASLQLCSALWRLVLFPSEEKEASLDIPHCTVHYMIFFIRWMGVDTGMLLRLLARARQLWSANPQAATFLCRRFCTSSFFPEMWPFGIPRSAWCKASYWLRPAAQG